MIFAKMREVVKNLADPKNSPEKCIDVEFVKTIANMTPRDIGKFLLLMYKSEVDFPPRDTFKEGTAESYVEMVRSNSDYGVQLFYTLKYIGTFHKITKKSVEALTN